MTESVEERKIRANIPVGKLVSGIGLCPGKAVFTGQGLTRPLIQSLAAAWQVSFHTGKGGREVMDCLWKSFTWPPATSGRAVRTLLAQWRRVMPMLPVQSLPPTSESLLSSVAAGGGGGSFPGGRCSSRSCHPPRRDSGDPQAMQNPPVWLTAWHLQSRTGPDPCAAQF